MLQTLRADLYQSYQIKLDDFSICCPIKTSDSSEYYIIQHKNTKEKFWAKLCLIKHDEHLKSAFQEILSMIQVTHPAITKLYGYSLYDFDHSNNPVIVTKYIGTYSLYDLFMDQKLSRLSTEFTQTHRLMIIYGIASALSALHSNNIIIPNFQPTHVLLDANFRPFLNDFYSSSTEYNLDSLAYIAPEFHQSKKHTQASNVYSFGIMLYQFLTGINPFGYLNIKTNYVLIKKIVSGARPIFKTELGIPESYKNLIQRCWAADPLQRPSFEDIVKEFTNIKDTPTNIEHTLKGDSNYFFHENYIYGDVDTNYLMEYIESLENRYQVISFNKETSRLQYNFQELSDEYASNIHLLYQLNHFISQYKCSIDELEIIAKEKIKNFPIANRAMSFSELSIQPPAITFGKLLKNKYQNLCDFRSQYENMIKDLNLGILQRTDVKSTQKPNLTDTKSKADIEADINTFSRETDEFIKAMHYKFEIFEEIAKILPEDEFKHQKLDPAFIEIMKSIENGNMDKIDDLVSRANNGCIDSLNALGIVYRVGKFNMPKDPEKSIEYFKKAAKLGHVQAINSVGVYFETVFKCYDKAFLLYVTSSRKGSTIGLLNLGRCFLYGYGIEKDQKKALLIFSQINGQTGKINSNSSNEAKYWLSLMYFNGYGVDKNITIAIEFLKPLIEKNHKESFYLMGKCYLELNDYMKAIEIFQKGDELGNVHATYQLGLCYQRIGNKVDGFNCIKKAVDNGLNNALIDLGRCYEEGTGTKKDTKKAFELYLLAGKNKINEANVYLEYCYREGIGVEKDEKKANEYHSMFQRDEQRAEGPIEFEL